MPAVASFWNIVRPPKKGAPGKLPLLMIVAFFAVALSKKNVSPV